jgi:hypothetical protein
LIKLARGARYELFPCYKLQTGYRFVTMTALFAACSLCQQLKELQDSHLFPAALYKRLRTNERSDKNPVVIGKQKTLTSSKQASAHLLCADCEQLFNKKGENFVLRQCALPKEGFRLRDSLQDISPIETTEQYRAYDLQQVPGSKVEDYLYYAASIFWRASVHSWKIGDQKIGQISLGSKYEEEFRQYLVGKTDFPSNARLCLHISCEATPDQTLVFPCTSRITKVHRHTFYIPGIQFILLLGSEVSKQFDSIALNGSERKIAFLCSFREGSLFKGALNLIKQSKPTGKLRR